jgi:hypothetical protein
MRSATWSLAAARVLSPTSRPPAAAIREKSSSIACSRARTVGVVIKPILQTQHPALGDHRPRERQHLVGRELTHRLLEQRRPEFARLKHRGTLRQALLDTVRELTLAP